jgi:TrmH family RNA methyltransferase
MPSPVIFVLVGTRAPGNIGAVCRLAKAFGFPEVRLVAPVADPAGEEARWLAHGAEDVLAAIRTYAGLRDALADCDRTAATTARARHWGRPVLSPEEAAVRLRSRTEVTRAAGHDPRPYAVVFGPEDRGLTNEELAACDEILSIPLPADAGATLSLPHAATVVAYVIARGGGRMAGEPVPAARGVRSERSSLPLGATDLDALLEEILDALTDIGFRPRPDATRFRGSLRDFLSRARPTAGDRALLQGVFAQIGKWRRRIEGGRRRGE